MKLATLLADDMSDSIYKQILEGQQQMHKRHPMPEPVEHGIHPKKKTILPEKPVDIDKHKQMMRRFRRLHSKMVKDRNQRSIKYF